MEGYTSFSIGRLSVLKMSLLPELIYRFNKIQIKTQENFSVDNNKLILKLKLKGKETRLVQTILRRIKLDLYLLISRITIKLQ